jgi:hypothetical protein
LRGGAGRVLKLRNQGLGSRGRKEIIVPLAFMEPMSGPLQDRVSRGSAGGRIGGAKLLE